MRPRFTFQTLILLAITPVVVVLSAYWAWQAYGSAQRVILQGFDRKLLAIAGGTAEFVDGDAHAAFQRARTIQALATERDGVIGFDSNFQELLLISSSDGRGRPIPSPVPGVSLRSLASTPADRTVWGLGADGRSLYTFKIAQVQKPGMLSTSSPLGGIVFAGDELLGWNGTTLFKVDRGTGALTAFNTQLTEPLASIAAGDAAHPLVGLTSDRKAIVILDAQGRLTRRVPLLGASSSDGSEPAGPPSLPQVSAIVFSGRQLLGAGDSLVSIDLATGVVSRSGFAAGYYDITSPFYEDYGPAFVELQKSSGLTYLYTQVFLGGNRISYMLDGTMTSDFTQPGTLDEAPPEIVDGIERVQFGGRPWISEIQPWENWGLIKSCFMPIRDSNGQTVAMVGADVNIGMIREKTRWAAFRAILIGAASLIVAGGLSFRIARTLKRPLQKLKEATLWIAAGYHGARIEESGTQELKSLASVLDQLRARLDSESTRVGEWRRQIREARQHTALAQALEQCLAHVGGTRLAQGGACHRGNDAVWWFTPEAGEPTLGSDCGRTRHATLALELLAAGRPHASVPSMLLAANPEIEAAACWHEETNTLHYQTRQPVRLCTTTTDRRVNGSGQLRFGVAPDVEWAKASGETQTPIGGTAR